MRKSKLDIPKVKEKVIQELALCKSQTSIAKEVGVTQPQISRFASRDDIKPLIEKQVLRLVDLAPDALDNVEEVVKDKVKDIPRDNIKRRKFVIDTSLEVLRGVTILPSNVQNQTILHYYQNKYIPSPQVKAFLDAHIKTLEWPYNADGSLKPGYTLDSNGNPILKTSDIIDVSEEEGEEKKE